MSDGSNDVGNDCSLQFAWMEKFHVSFDIPDRAIIFSLPPPVALMHIESNKGGATNNVNVSKDREKSPARDSNNDQSFSRENVSRTSVVSTKETADECVSVDTHLLGDILVPESDRAMLVADGAVSGI